MRSGVYEMPEVVTKFWKVKIRAGSRNYQRREKRAILEQGRSSMSVDSTCTSCVAEIVGDPVSRTERSEDLLVGVS